jgi:hypothetical protein
MTDQTKYDIDFLNAQNKYRTYQEKKKATEQIKELLKKHSSDTLIDMIMKRNKDEYVNDDNDFGINYIDNDEVIE